MTRPPPEDLRSPEVRLPPVIACSAGSGAAVDVSVRHRGSEPALLTITVLGLDARWVPEPVVIGPLDPGESTTISLTLVPERGTLGARYPFVVAVEATTRQSEPPVMGVAESVLAVDARERIAVAIVPNISSAVFGRRVEVQVTNPSQEDRALQLESTHAGGATLRLADSSIVVPAGRTGTVRGRIKVRHPRFLGSGSVHTVGVTARSTAAPEFAEASLRSRPVIRNGLRAAVAVGLVLALWAAAAIIFIPRLSDRFTAKNTPPVATAGSTAPASGSGAAGTGAGGTGATGTAASGPEGTGAEGTGAEGTGTGGTGAPATGAPVTPGAPGDSASGDERLIGAVTGPGADGVIVVLQPTSLAGGAAAGATPTDKPTADGLRAASGPFGKVPEAALQLSRDDGCSNSQKMTTTADGAFAFGCISSPGFYLLSLARKGFGTQRYIVNAATLADADPLEVALIPGDGTLFGAVTGPDGPVGAATVSITDGTVSLSTSTVSPGGQGTPGSWTVDGLSTPGNYLVTVSAPGLGTSSQLVELPAKGRKAANLTLQRGVAAISGTVSGTDELGVDGGLGGVTVSATDGETTRTATTVTTGVVGSYALPDLPAPGEYTLTVTGTGFSTQTRTVTIPENVGGVTADVSLNRSNGGVTGLVRDGTSRGKGLPAVGLTLTGKDTSYKTMSLTNPLGRYSFTGVVPGTYVLTAQLFGRKPLSVPVTVTAAENATANLVLVSDQGASTPRTSFVVGTVTDARSGAGLKCDRSAAPTPDPDCVVTVTGTIPGVAKPVSSTGTATAYTWPDPGRLEGGLPAGLYDLTLTAPGFETVSIRVSVPENDPQVAAPQVAMQPLGVITGTVTPKVGTPRTGSPTCAVAVDGIGTISGGCVLSKNHTQCTVKATTDARCSVVASSGKYTILGLTHGSYQVTMIPTDPEYLTTDPRTVQLDFGADVVVDAALDRYGRMTLTVLAPDLQTGALRPAEDADVVVTPNGDPKPPAARPDTGKTAADGTFSTVGLLGNYTVNASGFPGTASVETGEVGLNQTLQVTIALTRSIGVAIGRVTTTVDGATVPVGNAKVTVSGIIGYKGSTPIIGSATPVTDDNGCYAVVPDGWTAATGPAAQGLGCPDPAGGALPPVGAGQAPGPGGRPPAIAVAKDSTGKPGSLAALRVDLSVAAADTRTEPFTAENIVIGGAEKPPPYVYALRAVPEILVAAQPSGFGTHTLTYKQAPIQSRTVDWSDVIFSVTKKPAGSGAVTLSLIRDDDTGGTLTFRDSSQAVDDKVVPGTYEVGVSLVGFADTSFVLKCDLGKDCVLTQSGTDTVANEVVLFELAAITGLITADKPAPGVTASQAQVTVVTVPSNAGLVTVAVTADLANNGVVGLRDANLFAALVVPGTYVFSVALKGYATQLITVTCGDDYRTGCTSDASTAAGALSPVMKRLPEFAGNVTLSPQTLPGGVRVSPTEIKVVIVSQSNPSVSATVTVVDDGDDPGNPSDRIGHLVWNDTALPLNIIMPGDYTLQLTRKGYQTMTVPFSCDVQDATCGPSPITMPMLPQGAGSVTVPAPPGGESPAFTAPGVVTFTGPGGTSSLKISLEPDPLNTNQATLVWDDTAIGIPGLTQPGEYTITIEVPGYQPDSQTFPCDPGTVCAPTFAPILRPVFSGKANLAPPRVTFPPLVDAKFTVTGSTGTVLLSAAADGTLTWQETGWPKNLVREGSYQITGTLAGFEMPPTPFRCDGPTTCTLTGITFYEPSQLRVVITGGSPPAPVLGAQMTLSGNTIPDTPANAGGSDRVTFGAMSTLPTSTYALSVVAAGFARTDLGPTSPADKVTCGPEFGVQTAGLKLYPGGTTVCTVVLSPIGTIVGHVRGRTQLTANPATYTYSDLQGVTVSACRQADPVATSEECVAGSPTFTGVSGPGGIVRITGTSTNPGLLAGTWRVTASGVGFERTTGSVVITSAFQMASANPPRSDALVFETPGQVFIDLPVQAVTLQIKPQSFGTPVLPAGTYTLSGANGTASCVVPVSGASTACAFPNGPPGGPAVPMIRLTGINPGTYNLKATPANPDNPEFVPIEQVVVVQIPTTSNLLIQDAPINLFLRSSSLRITVSRPGPGTGPDPWTANSSVTLVDANTGLPAQDLDGKPLQGPLVPTGTDRLAAGIAFARVPDGFYRAQIIVPGYTPIVSGSIQMWAAVSPTPPPVPFTLVRATRTVNLTLGSTAASTAGGPPADLVGATIAFQQISTVGSAPPDTGSYTATAGPGGYVTAPQLPTGTWRAVVTGSQTGGPTSTDPAFRPRSTEFDVPDPTIANSDALARSATVAQGLAMFALSWPKTSCSSADGPTTSVTIRITRTDVDPDVPITISAPVTSTAAEFAAAGSVYLPPGQYSWTTSGLPSGWGNGSGTFPITVAANAAVGSVAPVTETDTLAPATVPVTVTMQVDGADFPGVTVTASRTGSPTSSSPISGGTASLCLAAATGWTFSVDSATVLLDDKTQAVTAAGPNTVPFVGFSLTPSAQLAAVAGRTADSRAVVVTVRQGGAAVWTATPSPNLTGTTTYTGPKLVLPTGSYTLRATPPAGDEFGEITSSAVAVATVHTVDVTLPYVRAMFTVTVTADGAPAGAATVSLSDGGGSHQTNTSGEALFADLETGTYDITATKGTRTGTKANVAVPVGTSGTTVPLGAAPAPRGLAAGRRAGQTTSDQPAPSTEVPPPATSSGKPTATGGAITTGGSTPTTSATPTPTASRSTASPTPPAAAPTATTTATSPPPTPTP